MYFLKKFLQVDEISLRVSRDKTCLENPKMDLDLIEHLWTKNFQKIILTKMLHLRLSNWLLIPKITIDFFYKF